MAINNNPDLLYVRSREALLQYEDARMNALLQAVADFYTTRNDQSIWGNFLRGLAIELSKLDYDYSYDIVNKDPSLLTPPDIRRRWAANLYISSNWPSPQQFDIQYKNMLVELLAAYKLGTTVQAIENVIFAYTGLNITVVELYTLIGNGVYDQSDRNSLSVAVNVGAAGSNPLTTVTSLAQLQGIVQSLYGAIALAKPAHVGLEFQTVFGEGEEIDCLISPQTLTQQQYIQIPSSQQQYYQQTGYTQINPALFWKATTDFVLGNMLRDVNGNFQLLTSTGAFPNNSGATVPVWNTTYLSTTTDGDLTWTLISPAVLATSITNNVATITLNIAVPLDIGVSVKLINLAHATFLNGVPLTVTSVSNNGLSFTATFTHADNSTVEPTGTATFGFPANINFLQFGQLDATWKALYQLAYTNYCCCPQCVPVEACDTVPQGITDTLRIFVLQSEAEPFGPMLILAPIKNPPFSGSASSWTGGTPAEPPWEKGQTFGYQNPNPRTTVAAYGRLLAPTLTPAQWALLPNIYVNILNGFSDGINATYSYVATTQFLHDGEPLTITGFSNAALNVTAQIKAVTNLAAQINATSVTSNVVTVFAPNSFSALQLVTLSGLTNAAFLNGQSLVIVSATPTSFTVSFTTANYTKTADTGNAEVSTFQIPNTTVIALVEVPSPKINAGIVTPTLQSGYYLTGGSYKLGLPPIANSGAGIGSSWVPSGNVFQGQIIVDSNGFTQVALNAGTSGPTAPTWLQGLNVTTNDNGVQWRNVGKDTFIAPNTWVGVLNFDSQAVPTPFTGEVGNWDSQGAYGLVAPHYNQAWEISGNPQDQDFIFGLY